MNEVYVPSTIRRFFALSIDQIFLVICYLPFAKSFYNVLFTQGDVEISLFQLSMIMLIPLLYEAVSLMLLSATPGKSLLGLKVVPAHNPNEELDYTQCILRPLTSRLTFFFSWGIYALALFRYDRTHLSDWVAETRVVQFKPRDKRTRVRWIIGTFLVLSYTWAGLANASQVINAINWQTGKADLRAIVGSDEMNTFQFDLESEDNEGE